MKGSERVPFMASFERPQAFSPQGHQTPLGAGTATQLLQETKHLLELQLWESASILISFLLSGNQQTRELDQTECLVLQGDALRGLNENRRAVELGDWDAAVKELQAIPRSDRNATINSFLGKLYQRLGRTSRAIESYKACLQQQPIAIEAAIALASAGVCYEEIAELAPIMAGVSTMQPMSTPEPLSSQWGRFKEEPDVVMQHLQPDGRPLENCTSVDGSTPNSHDTAVHRQSAPCVGVHPGTDLGSPILAHTLSKCSATVQAGANLLEQGAGENVERCSVLGDELVFPVMPAAATPRVWDDIQVTPPMQSQPSLEHGRVPMEDASPSSGAVDNVPNVPMQTAYQQPGPDQRIGNKLFSEPSCPAVVEAESMASHDRPPKRRRLSMPHIPSVYKEQSQAALMHQMPQQAPCGQRGNAVLGVVEPCKASGTTNSSHVEAFGSPCLTGSTPSPIVETQASVGSGWRSTANRSPDNVGICKMSSLKSSCGNGAGNAPLPEGNRAVRAGMGWYGVLIQAHVHLCKAQNSTAAHLFNQLAAVFPAEIHTLLGAAAALLAAGDQVGAMSTFQRARKVDSLNVRGMDGYARLLLELNNTKELHSLSQDMLAVDPELPEVWAVTACFWMQHKDWERSLEAVSRGLKHRPDHIGLRLAKGRYLLHKKDCEGALAEFRTVLQSCNDSVAFNGAVHACLMLRRFPEACLHARTALNALPGSANAQYLFGCVLFQTPGESPEDAERCMRRALQLDPAHREAALVIVNMLQQRQEWDDAVELLKGQLVLRPTDALHVRLGQVHRAAGHLAKAADAFQAALGLNAGNRVAIEALEEIGAMQMQQSTHARRQASPCIPSGLASESHVQLVAEDGASVDWVARATGPNHLLQPNNNGGAPMYD